MPFLGSDAARNWPVRFELQQVRVGGGDLPLSAAEPQRCCDRVTFDRGAVQEHYDLALEQVEQTFVVDAPAGDVELVLRVVTELVEDPAAPGIQFGNELGRVEYGQAQVVDGARLHPVRTEWVDGTIRIRVPAALRGPGPLVIDPILYTGLFSGASLLYASTQPDLAYDADSDQYLMVWQRDFSAVDGDILCEFHTAAGAAIAGSLDAIDISGGDFRVPRVANLNAGDRFLVVMQSFQAGRWSIFARLRLAASPVHPILFRVDDASLVGNCVNPDIGGDPSPTAGDRWLVVWERQVSTSDSDIHGRHVRIDTSLPGTTLLLDNTSDTVFRMPTVSQSNGNGQATAARWLVAYQFRFSATDEDVYGCSVGLTGITTGSSAIDTALASDQVPSVSSPNTTAANGNPLFLVTYERQGTFHAMARLLSGGLVSQFAPVDLTSTFGLGGFWVRAECDGTRFAVLNGAATIGVATLAYDDGELVLHEATQNLSGSPSYPRLCSTRSGGGPPIDFGITSVDESLSPYQIRITTYDGRQAGDGFAVRSTGCNALGIAATGRPFLGDSATFVVSNLGADLPGFVFGNPAPASALFCSFCSLGVDPNGLALVLGSALTVPIPPQPSLVGATFAVQGLGLGSGPCIAALRFSNTIDLTVR